MATYQLLPTSASTSSLHQPHQQQSPPVQQRKALSFTILILMVATATLITIIRFTVNPNLNGQTFVQPTNAFALHYRREQQMMLAKQQLEQQQQQKRPLSTFDRRQPVKQIGDSGNGNVKNKFNTLLSRDPTSVKLVNLVANNNDESKKDEKMKKLPLKSSSSFLTNNNSNNVPINIQPDLKLNPIQQQSYSVSPSSKTSSVTSLMADQRFEKDYRDDPITQSTVMGSSTLNSLGLKKSPIKVIFDREDLAETERMNIDKEDGCGEDQGAYADLLVLVNSAVFNFDARNAIRETWGKFSIERGAYFYFLLGSTDDQRIQDQVQEEDFKYGDILQGTFQDNYYNLTLKTITMMNWITKKCSKIRYVLKVDDDMMINMQHACDFTEINPNFHKVIIGKLAKKWKPHRSRVSKWFVPYEAYNQTYFPNFVTGPAYFFTGDAARPLWETSISNRTTAFYLEDVFMTGIVAETAGIKRYNHAMMRNVHLKLDSCTFPKIMTSHKHKPDEIRQLWKSLYFSGQKCIKQTNNIVQRTTPKSKIIIVTNSQNNSNSQNKSDSTLVAKNPSKT
uniref:Lactosylceramide 1,3-N-acetyl-beta-D-glucosaminyltransferase B-like n=1 Tax=Dermatophagoides pteronyssinus TaxID=6956 RepID=A0A6P6YHL9_DERPT|nr:lactosylceramide 1,3-N-acetyl-beta-D-glucosaminyltransferase B-like [Dermatophagoides pteronyssinus]